jgi:hypothetical protein
LLDQPALAWELVDLAGMAYQTVMDEQERIKAVMQQE